jgi:hypothetical protein
MSKLNNEMQPYIIGAPGNISVKTFSTSQISFLISKMKLNIVEQLPQDKYTIVSNELDSFLNTLREIEHRVCVCVTRNQKGY